MDKKLNNGIVGVARVLLLSSFLWSVQAYGLNVIREAQHEIALTPPHDGTLAKQGYLDVTLAGVSNDGTGDQTVALQNAINEAFHRNLIAFFPAGTYQISGQIRCVQQRDHMTDVFALVGSASGARPVIKLIDNSSGFGNSNHNNNKPLFWFQAIRPEPSTSAPPSSPVLPSEQQPTWDHGYDPGTTPQGPDKFAADGSDNYGGAYNMVFKGIDIDLGNNIGAIGIRMHACQGSTIQDVKVYSSYGSGNNFCAGFRSTVGAGAIMGNLEVVGGKYGFYIADLEGPGVHMSNCPTLLGITLTNQTVSAIYTKAAPSYSPITVAGFHITKATGPVFTVNGNNGNNDVGGSMALIDGAIELGTVGGTAIINTDASLYMQNVYFKNAATIVDNNQGVSRAGESNGWVNAVEYSFNHIANTAVVYSAKKGARTNPDINNVMSSAAPDIENLKLRHIWNDSTFPHFELSNNIYVYPSAGGDTQNIQDAIDLANSNGTGQAVVLGRGYFDVYNTINLHSDTKLIGASRHLTTIDASGWDNNTGTNKPVFKSPADADATTLLAFFRIAMPRNQGNQVYWLEWQSGRHSMIREVWFQKYNNIGTDKKDQDIQRLWIHGATAGGRIYGLFARNATGDSKHVNFRHLLVEGTRDEPLYIYAYCPEYAFNGTKYQAEVRDSRNVTFLGFKGETQPTQNGVNSTPDSSLAFTNACQNVAVFGSEGIDWFITANLNKGLIEFSADTVGLIVANKGRRWHSNKPQPESYPSTVPGHLWFEVYDKGLASHLQVTISDPFVSLVKRGSPMLVPVEPQSGGGGSGGGGGGSLAGNNTMESYHTLGAFAVHGSSGAEFISGANADEWEFVSISGNEYQIRNGSNYLQADNSGGWKVITHQAVSGGDSQIWIVEDATGSDQGEGNYTIRSKTTFGGAALHICYADNNGKFFTTTGGVLWKKCAFDLVTTGGGTFTGNNSMESFTNQGSFAANGAVGADLSSNTNGDAWEFVHISGEEYRIRSGNNYLQADDSGDWKVITHQEFSSGDNQVWIIEDATGGTHTIRSKATLGGDALHICYASGSGKFFTTLDGVSWNTCKFIIAEAADNGFDNKIVFIENAGTGDHLTFSGGASGSTATLTATPGSGDAYKWKLLLVAGTTNTYTIESQYEATVKHFCTNHTSDWGQGRVYSSIQGTNGDRGKFKIVEDGGDYTIMLVEGSRYLYDSGAENYPRSHASPSANDLWTITIAP